MRCFFRHNAVAHLIDYTIVQALFLYTLGSQKISMVHFISIYFIAVVWN